MHQANDHDMRQRRRESLKRMLRPRHIAYIGGGQTIGAITASQACGFDGALWVVNPLRDDICGLKCYTSIEDLPEAPDLALIALSSEKSIEAVTALAAMGAGCAVCMADGFAEVGCDGASLQQQLQQAAADLAVIGPNCMGVLNLFEGASAWGAGGHIEDPGLHGAAIISQSGAFLFGITNVEQGFPLGYAISTGNQAVTDMADCIEAMLMDERVSAIGIYLEGLDDGKALANACWHAFEKGIPIIALKGGDTAEAETVAISHTSAMVVERDLWQAFCERYGIVEVSSPKAMVETLKLLSVGGIPAGNRVSAITVSGGLNSLIVARAANLGLRLEQPTASNSNLLRSKMPQNIPVANPLDLNLPWASKVGMSLQDGDDIAECLCRFTSEVADAAVFFLDVPRPDALGSDKDWYPGMEAMAAVKTSLGIPCAVAGILPEGLVPDLRRHLIDLGIAPLLGFSDAMEALSVAARVGQLRHERTGISQPGELLTDRIGGTATRSIMLDEAESKTALRNYGLKTPVFNAVNAAQAAEYAADIGFPVALKLISSSISHKARIGGVKLGLESKTAVDGAVAEIIESAGLAAGVEIDTFLIERMVTDPCEEYIIGVKRQAALGLALMIGRGGSSVESMKHFVTVLLPLVDTDLQMALSNLGFEQITPGYAAMLEAIRAVAAYALDHAQVLQSLDVNPVMLSATGEAIATDALIVLNGEN
ncbi:MAG: acetate--CoA ligase family protein [Gammaproteobacteria bacterium]|nr:acetate--CoA ligase family protein [Gammaproteobacteria bacterium]